ncbi:MAG: T9SS type A sorting domain-containing protein, partial [Bacteroidota bacterium]
CNYVENGQTLGGPTSNLGTPNFVETVFLAAPGGAIDGCVVLDITLNDFTAWPTEDRKVQLEWNAIEDATAKHYEIERSFDGMNFTQIGVTPVQPGAGEFHDYQFKDHGPGEGLNYYRLRMVDFDGQFDYSEVREVQFDEGISGWVAYPVPAQSQFTLTRALPRTGGEGVLSLYNEIGQQVWTYRPSAVETEIQVDASQLAAGVYYLRYVEGESATTMDILLR